MTSAAGPDVSTQLSAWTPLRIFAFRALWIAQLAGMTGTWMQTVGAQWLLVDEPNATTLVALVQTLSMLPVLVLALPSGVVADSFDRRRWLVIVQSCSFVVALALTVTDGTQSGFPSAAADVHVPARLRRGPHPAGVAGTHSGHRAARSTARGGGARRHQH